MDDARRFRRIHAAPRRRRGPSRLGPLVRGASWALIPAIALPGSVRDAAEWRPEYGWILGAGITCLAAAWLLARLGARHEVAARGLGSRQSPAWNPPAVAKTDRLRWEDRLALETHAVVTPLSSGITTPAGRSAPRLTTTPAVTVRMHERLGFDMPRRPVATTAWLHLVSAPTPAATARAACRIAAELIPHGARVLLIDATRRCVLHARFGRESRWGVGECLARELPILGVVQPTAHAALHLLARGGEPRLLWEGLGRLADEAHVRYAHVLVALDPDTPRAAGDGIVGRLVEGWWGGGETRSHAAMALSERLGIAFSALAMEPGSEVTLEATSAPLLGLESSPGPEPAAVAARPMIVPDGTSAAHGLPLLGPVIAAAEDVRDELAALFAARELGITSADVVVPCDDDVRARLQFLMWVRGIAGRRPAAEPSWKLATTRG